MYIEYIKKEDKALAIDEHGKISTREYTDTLEEELVTENCIEYIENKLSEYPTRRKFIFSTLLSISTTIISVSALALIIFKLAPNDIEVLLAMEIFPFTILGLSTSCHITSFRKYKNSNLEKNYLKEELEKLKVKRKALASSQKEVVEQKLEEYGYKMIDDSKEKEYIDNGLSTIVAKKKVRTLNNRY